MKINKKLFTAILSLFLTLPFLSNQEVQAGGCSSNVTSYHSGYSYSQLYEYVSPYRARFGYHAPSSTGGQIDNASPSFSYVDYYAPNRPSTTISTYGQAKSTWGGTDRYYWQTSLYHASNYTTSIADGSDWWWYPINWSSGVPSNYRFKEESGDLYTYRRPIRADYSATLTVADTTDPTISASTTSRNWDNTDPSTTVTVKDTGGCSSTVAYRYLWNTTTTQPSSGYSAWSGFSASKSVALSKSGATTGTWYLHVEAKDDSGNIRYARFGGFKVDKSKSTLVSVSVTGNEYTSGSTRWVKVGNPFQVKLRGNDDQSGILVSYIRLYNSSLDARVAHRYDDTNTANMNYFSQVSAVSFTSASRTYNSNGEREVTFTGDINYDAQSLNVHYYFTDYAGNVFTDYVDSGIDIRSDGTAPTVTVSPNGSTTYINDNTITISASDGGSGLSGYRTRVSNDNGATYGAWSGYQTASKTVTLTNGANRVIHVEAKDNVGNVSNVYKTFDIDTVAPTIKFLPNSTSVYMNDNTIVISATDATSGLYGFRTRVSNDNGATWTAWSGYQTANKTITLTDGLNRVIQVEAKDNAGNVSTASQTYDIDTVKPTVTFNPNGSSVYINDNTVVITVADDRSGVYGYRTRVSNDNGVTYSAWSGYQTASKTITLTDGPNRVIQVEAKDIAGNILTTSRTFDIDTVKPTFNQLTVTSANLYKTTNAYWVKNGDNVKFNLKGYDLHSGVNDFNINLTFSGGSVNARHVWNTSTTNLTENPSNSLYDFTSVTHTINSSGTREVAFNMTTKCTTASCTANLLYKIGDTANNILPTVTDTGFDLKVDNKAPTITTGGVANGAVYVGKSVTPTFSVADGESGIKTQTATLKRTNNGATTTSAFTSGTTITASGDYELFISVTDNVNRITSRTILFTVYKSPAFTLNVTDSFLYPLKTNLRTTSNTSSDRNEAVITLYYQVKENTGTSIVTHPAKMVSSTTRNTSGVWSTAGWISIDLNRIFIENLTDGKHRIEFWAKDEHGATSSVVATDFVADSAVPTGIKLYYLPSADSKVALNSTIKYAVSAYDPVARDGSYLYESKVGITFEVRKNGVLIQPQPARQIKNNNEPTVPISMFLGTSSGYNVGDVVTIKVTLDDLRGNTYVHPTIYKVTIQ